MIYTARQVPRTLQAIHLHQGFSDFAAGVSLNEIKNLNVLQIFLYLNKKSEMEKTG
jgi:hypothetical protein